MRHTVGKKLGLGFGAIFLLIGALALFVHLKLTAIMEIADRITSQLSPAAFTCSSLEGRLTLTQKRAVEAILSGLGPDQSEQTAKLVDDAWKSVNGDLSTLEALSRSWTVQEDLERLAGLKTEVTLLQQDQFAAMRIAHSNQRDAVATAGKAFSQTATPHSQHIRKILNELSDDQFRLLHENQQRLAANGRTLNLTMLLATSIVLILGASVAIFLGRGISAATSSALNRAKAIARGDLTGAEIAIVSSDELGDLAAAINAMQTSLQCMIRSISENAQRVLIASEECSFLSKTISANSGETSAQASLVCSAAEHVKNSLLTVASGSEQMSVTIRDIAQNARAAAHVAREAVASAQAASSTITQLNDSNAQISQVVKVITSIAQQTNLLALNATIEAARAGEYGKGFAVVANEVKQLAKQTAQATEDISARIAGILSGTKTAVSAVSAISGIISKVNDISMTIATAVEQQSATTNEMSRNIGEAAGGSASIVENIAGVSHAAENTTQGASESLQTAQRLSLMSVELSDLVGRFTLPSNGHDNRRAA
jgi:methyl-accepting chemotaxis protein